MGWLQNIDYDELLDALPDGATVGLHLDVGDFVAAGERVAELGVEIDDATVDRMRSAFTLERVRSNRHDLAYAFQQLIDVAEHAMAPHSADTSTAYEALVHLRAVLHVLIRRGTASGNLVGPRGCAVVSYAAWSTVDHLQEVFARLGHAADDPAFDRQLRRMVDALLDTADEVGDQRSVAALRRIGEQFPTAGGSPDRTPDPERGSAS